MKEMESPYLTLMQILQISKEIKSILFTLFSNIKIISSKKLKPIVPMKVCSTIIKKMNRLLCML